MLAHAFEQATSRRFFHEWQDKNMLMATDRMQRLWRAVLAVFALAAAPVYAQQQLSIATAGTGGVYYPLGGGLAEIINQYVSGYAATAEVTGGSVENMGLIARGDADLAIALGDTVAQAFAGRGRFEGQRLPMVSGLSSLYMNMVQIVTLADSGISTLPGLKGKRVSVGAPGSGTEVNAQAILAANGLGYDDIEVQRLNFNETADALANGDIDAGFWSVAAPTSAIMNLAIKQSVRMIELSDREIAATRANDPIFTRATLAAGTYIGVDQDVTVLGIPNVLVASADMPDDLAYAITKAMYEHLGSLSAIHPAARQRSRSNSQWTACRSRFIRGRCDISERSGR
jgi:TRAP transporter TAXI family solute receptor